VQLAPGGLVGALPLAGDASARLDQVQVAVLRIEVDARPARALGHAAGFDVGHFAASARGAAGFGARRQEDAGRKGEGKSEEREFPAGGSHGAQSTTGFGRRKRGKTLPEGGPRKAPNPPSLSACPAR